MSNVRGRTKQKVQLRATITRADGTVEDLGVIASSEDQLDPNSKIGKIYYTLKRKCEKLKNQEDDGKDDN